MISAIESLATGNIRSSAAMAAPRYQPLLVVAIALAAGIAFDKSGWIDAGASSFATTWWIALGGIVAWWWFWRGGQPAISAWLLLGAVAAAGGSGHDLNWELFPRNDVGRFAALEPAPACVTASVLTPPETLPAPPFNPLRAIPSGERCRVVVQIDAIRDGTDWLPADGRCQLVVDGDLLGVAPGDRLQIFAQLRRLAPPMNPGQFNFAARARADRRLASLITQSPDCVTVIAPNNNWAPSRIVDDLRALGQRTLRTYVGSGQAGLAAAVLLGNRDELPYEATMPFFLTGTVHLLVVSGLNVAILATGLYALVWIGWLPRRTALALIMIAVVVYALVAGADPPVLRATVLVSIACVGLWTGRRGAAFNALAAAAIVAMVLDPSQLFHTGTQLSFLCVAILIWVGQSKPFSAKLEADPLEQLIASTRPWYEKVARSALRWTWFLLLTSAVMWLVTLPLVLYRFHVASPVALLISPVVWLLALVAMWSGFVALACGFLVPLAAVVAGALCGYSLQALVAVVDWAEAIPGGHFWAPGPAIWWLLGFYLGLFAVMVWGQRLLSGRWQVGLAAAWIVIGLMPPLARHFVPHDELRCTFVAMGHGTCVVLETPDGQTLVYDAGSLGSPEFATDAVAGYLWERGILRIDGLILSHADVDHYNAVPGLLKRFYVGAVYVSPMMFDWYGATGPGEAPQVLLRAIEEAGVPIREVFAGDRLHVGEVTIDVIHPPQRGVVGSDNANSITAEIEYAGRRLILPGDLETPGLEEVIAERPIDCDVLMAPHHGSRRSDPPGFVAWSTPEWVVISGSADADAEVERTYAARGAKVFNTGGLGAIEIKLNRDSITASSYRPVIPR
jgi:competence protein ComEC